MRKKITVVGAGNVGATVAQRLFERGYADIVLVDPNNPWEVTKDTILYKCGWSPFEGEVFSSKVMHTFVNGHLVFSKGEFDESKKGLRLEFDRK